MPPSRPSAQARSRTAEPELIVVGAGHAGVEAALAAARLGRQVVLVTMRAAAVARMSCNPAIGGLGKGHLVREVDALGGLMGLAADATGIQFRRLNRRKGAAVRGTRAQSDRSRYEAYVARVVRETPGLRLVEGEVIDLALAGGRVVGVVLAGGQRLACRAVVLTTGTFLGGLLHCGDDQRAGGRRGEPAAVGLSAALGRLGLPLSRLKTGTPCRIDRRSIDFAALPEQPGDDPAPRFSFWSDWPAGRPPLPQLACHLTYTNPRTHEIIRDNLHRSPLYRRSSAISSTGPRYCPSIEDKVVRFADRPRHQIFLEPEGLEALEVYPNGISTSLPPDVQQALVHSIAGLERARLLQLGYAVEYDYCDPRALSPALQARGIEGLYLAGQINGSTGYEEAAAQGLVAGVNAARALAGGPPLRLGRDQAYIAVMIDDLVTQGAPEPYRMFTSRAEYRLLLREDNADVRLTPMGRELGLIDDARWARFCERQQRRERLGQALETTRVGREDGPSLDALLAGAGTTGARPGTTLAELLLRPQVGLELLVRAGLVAAELVAEPLVAEQAEIAIKYRGYIDKQAEQARCLGKIEREPLPAALDYGAISGLSNELRDKLVAQRPESLGQASRIPGMTPAAIALLHVFVARERRQGSTTEG